jgi:hypothetical protein
MAESKEERQRREERQQQEAQVREAQQAQRGQQEAQKQDAQKQQDPQRQQATEQDQRETQKQEENQRLSQDAEAAKQQEQERVGQARQAARDQVARDTRPVDPMERLVSLLEQRAPGTQSFDDPAPPPTPETRRGGLYRVGNRTVNAQGHEIRGYTEADDGKLYGGELYDPRTATVVRRFDAQEENVG